jgi:hypothetical protein
VATAKQVAELIFWLIRRFGGLVCEIASGSRRSQPVAISSRAPTHRRVANRDEVALAFTLVLRVRRHLLPRATTLSYITSLRQLITGCSAIAGNGTSLGDRLGSRAISAGYERFR